MTKRGEVVDTPGGVERLSAGEAAVEFATGRVANVGALFLAGSVIREDVGATSDLDLVVLADDVESVWSTHFELGWPIELFLRTPQGIADSFLKERQSRWPLLLNMCAEGRLLVDRSGVGTETQELARTTLAGGPIPLSESEIDWYRYNLTWMLDDVIDGSDAGELGLMVQDLVVTSIESALHLRGAWLGKGKWLIRNLREVDPVAAERVLVARRALEVAGDREPLVAFAREQLEAMGGRKFEGQSGNW